MGPQDSPHVEIILKRFYLLEKGVKLQSRLEEAATEK